MNTPASNQTSSARFEPLKAVWHQFLKDSDKLPGWVPLYVVTMVAVYAASPPDHIALFGRTLPFSSEFLAAALTLLFYSVGDAIDEVVFKTQREGKLRTRDIYEAEYADQKTIASGDMGIGAGSYQVAFKLVEAGEKYRARKFAIYGPNELAKCLRALIAPLCVLAFVYLLQGRVVVALTCLAGAVMSLTWYPHMKVRHIRLVYSAASELSQQRESYGDWELGTIRLVFWEGNFVGSAFSAPKLPRSIKLVRNC